MNAVNEARKLGIPTICLIDTDGDPDLADIAIPGNDDSMRSIDVIIRELCLAVSEGKTMRAAKTADASGADPTAGGQLGGEKADKGAPRRSSRPQSNYGEKAGSEPAAVK